MKLLSGIALAVLSGHACAAGRPTLDDMPAPVRSTLVHAYLENADPDKYSELFFEPAVIEDLPGAIVTLRVNDGAKVQQEQHRFFLPEKDERFCNEAGSVMRHAFDGEIVGEPKWRVALPVSWDERRTPYRTYADGVPPIDVIGTELCIAHFTSFGYDLKERTEALVAERRRQWEEQNAVKQARIQADVVALRACLRDREAIERAGEAMEREESALASSTDRLAIMRAGLEIQRGIIDSYKASAASRNEFDRQVRAYNIAAAEHDRNVKAHERVLARGRAESDRVKAECEGREFSGSAAQEVCRSNTSAFCEKVRKRF